MQINKFERGGTSRNYLWDLRDLIDFHLRVGKNWLKRGDNTKDIFAKFFFFFTGFNAIYFLWKKIDELNIRSEKKCIENLLDKFDELKSQEILDKVKTSVDYFSNLGPILKMNTGDISEGRKWWIKLQKNNISASEKLNAFAQILYLVRCNLFHGSKGELGDDRNIIKKSVEPLRVFLKEAISLTEQKCT